MSDKEKNFYEILDLNRDCKREEIKKSFIDKSKVYHPDKNKNSKYSHEKFLDICKAYETLSNPLKRQLYDQCLSLKYHSQNSGFNSSSSYSSSNTTYNNRLILKLGVYPKLVIAAALVFISLFGAGIQYHFISTNFDRKRAILENKSLMTGLILNHAKEQARIYGREEQARRLEQGILGQYDSTEIIEKYLKETHQKPERK